MADEIRSNEVGVFHAYVGARTLPERARQGVRYRNPNPKMYDPVGIASSLEHLGPDLRSAAILRDSRNEAPPRPFCFAVGPHYLPGAPSYPYTLCRSSGSSPQLLMAA